MTRVSQLHHLSYNTITIAAAVILILTGSGIALPFSLEQHQEAYASSQVQGPAASSSSSIQSQRPSTQVLPKPSPTHICNPNSPLLQYGSTGAKVAELQRVLTQVGYGSLLVGQAAVPPAAAAAATAAAAGGSGSSGSSGGIDGKFGISTQNAVKKFQQDNRLPVDGKVGPITWGALCGIIPNSFIVQVKSTRPSPLGPVTAGSLREIIGSLTPQIAAAGGRIAAVYDQFGMFNVVFEGPQAKRAQFINSLRANPAVQGVFNDHIVTATQLSTERPLQCTLIGYHRSDLQRQCVADQLNYDLEQRRLQRYMDNEQKTAQMISNILKRMNNTTSTPAKNIK